MNRIASLVIAQRGVMLAAAVALTALAVVGAMRLRFDDQPRRLFESDGPASDTLRQFFDDFGVDDAECLIVIQSDGLFEADAMRFVVAVASRARTIKGVGSVRSLFDVIVFNEAGVPRALIDAARLDAAALDAARSDALVHPLVAGLLLSDDATSTVIRVTLAGSIDEVPEIHPVVERIRQVIAGERTRLAEPERLSAGITGIPPLRVEIIQTIRHEQVLFLLIGLTLGISIAWIIFRHLAAVAIVILPPIIGATWTMGVLGWIGEPVNVINAVLPTLVLVIGFTDAVHLMVDMRRSRARGLEPKHTSMQAIRHLGPACALTSITTMIGFGSLAAARVDVIQRFGLSAAMGTFLTFCAVVTLAPILASFVSTPRLVSVERYTRREALRERGARIINPVLRAPMFVSIAAVILTILLGALALQLRPDNRLAESIPANRESMRWLQQVDRSFGGILQVFIVITWPEDETLDSARTLGVLDAAQSILDEHPLISHTFSIRNVLAALPGDAAARVRFLPALPADLRDPFVRSDRRRLAVIGRVPDAGAAVIEPALREIDARLAALASEFPDYEFALTGTTVVAARNIQLMIGDLARSLGLAAIAIFLALSVAFRSLRIGLISILPNVLPLVSTAALLVLTGQPLEITSVIVFSVCLGIAVDDTIHFIVRFRRERSIHDGDVRSAIRRSFVAVGAALIITTIVLLAGFGAGIFSEVPAIRLFAQLACFAITVALVGDLVILPALLAALMPEESAPDATRT